MDGKGLEERNEEIDVDYIVSHLDTWVEEGVIIRDRKCSRGPS